MFYLAAFLTLIFDQFTKYLIAIKMFPGQSIPIIKNVLHLTYVQNKGAAFGLLYGKQEFLIIVGAILILLLFYFYFKLEMGGWIQLPLGFIIGGSFGNIIDRIFRHYVVDFIDFRFWPVFNIADTMINVGVFLTILYLIFNKEKKHASNSI